VSNNTGDRPSRKRQWLVHLLLLPFLDISPNLPGDEENSIPRLEQLSLVNHVQLTSHKPARSHSSGMDRIKVPLLIVSRLAFFVFFLTRPLLLRDSIPAALTLFGLVLAPWTVLTAVIMWQPGVGLSGITAWLVVFAGFCVDMGVYGFLYFYRSRR
jgi:hypothetical protein